MQSLEPPREQIAHPIGRQEEAKPSLLARVIIAMNGEDHGWLHCPEHGYVYQSKLSGYHGPYYYRACPLGSDHYWVDLVGP